MWRQQLRPPLLLRATADKPARSIRLRRRLRQYSHLRQLSHLQPAVPRQEKAATAAERYERIGRRCTADRGAAAEQAAALGRVALAPPPPPPAAASAPPVVTVTAATPAAAAGRHAGRHDVGGGQANNDVRDRRHGRFLGRHPGHRDCRAGAKSFGVAFDGWSRRSGRWRSSGPEAKQRHHAMAHRGRDSG